MDPLATINEILAICADAPARDVETDTDRLRDLSEALVAWVRNGGFMPAPSAELSAEDIERAVSIAAAVDALR